MYARMLLSGKVDWVKLGRVFQPHQKMPDIKARRIVRQRMVQDMVQEELLKLYEKEGVTPENVIASEKELLMECKEKKDLTNWNKLLDKWRESIDLKPVKQHQITTTETNYLELLDKDGKIKAKQIKERNGTEDA